MDYGEDVVITRAHGGGGQKSAQLIKEVFVEAFSNDALNCLHDGARVSISSSDIVMTTDAYTVQPIFFPGGDIGKLAVAGTVNDLAMCGAKPVYLTCSFVIEEGIRLCDLQTIVASMRQEAERNGVLIVAGDTKVVERTSGNNIFITTTGVGVPMVSYSVHPQAIVEGDCIVLSGDIGRHGVAVMAARDGFANHIDGLESDCASVFPEVEALVKAGVTLHALRDATRGGLATVLVELAEGCGLGFRIHEGSIGVCSSVQSVAEILGLDPLYIANEGRFVAFVPAEEGEVAVDILRGFSGDAAIIGDVVVSESGVIMRNVLGVGRCLHRLHGDQLPRIC